MKINSSTDIFYQDTCGNATSHLPGGISWKTQGHQVESSLRNPQRILAANRKGNGIGSRDKEGAWGCNNRSTGRALPCFSLPKCEVRQWGWGWRGPRASISPCCSTHGPHQELGHSRERGGRITQLLTASDKEKTSAHTSDKSLISVSQGGFLPPPHPTWLFTVLVTPNHTPAGADGTGHVLPGTLAHCTGAALPSALNTAD